MIQAKGGGFQAKGAKEDLNQCLEAKGMDGVKLTQIKNRIE